jgi:outer membrane immunogenic protein
MKKLLAGCLVAGALLAAQSAGAADLSVAPLYKAPPAPPSLLTPAYNWTGLYFGVNGGGGWGRSWWSGNATGVNVSGGLIGGTVGYNWQTSNVVLGVEGDVDWSRLQHQRHLAVDRTRPRRLFVRPRHALPHRRSRRG